MRRCMLLDMQLRLQMHSTLPPQQTAPCPASCLDDAWQGGHIGNLLDSRQEATMLAARAECLHARAR